MANIQTRWRNAADFIVLNLLNADETCSDVCVQGLCGESCHVDSPCSSQKDCQNGRCLQKCGPHLLCPPNQNCIQGYCSKDCEVSLLYF